MLTSAGCKTRRERLLERLHLNTPLVLADPIHLCYFANFAVEPISQLADFGGLLVVEPNGRSRLFYDGKMNVSSNRAHVDDLNPVTWYTGQEPARGPRRMLLRTALEAAGGRIHDSLADPLAPELYAQITTMRRQKDPDEVELLKVCMRATEAGQAWGRTNIAAGMSELELYAGVASACEQALGHWAIVYGDFTVTTGTKRGGPPTPHRLQKGETFILDFSVIVHGYRSDFTNTLVVGGEPTAEQLRLFELCRQALDAGAAKLAPGVACQVVYDAMRSVFNDAGVADDFPTHGGHGLGLSHPEAPYIVRHSQEELWPGDVVTLEPGLYRGANGIRIEHNYLITPVGCERLSNHAIALV